MRAAIFLALALLASHSQAQDLVRPESHSGGILFVVRDNAGLATEQSPLYLASNHAGWNPGEPSMKLNGRSDLRWQILVPGPIGDPPLEFKFTRGSWETVEVAPDLADIANRTLARVPAASLEAGRPVVIELEVARFADERAGAARPQLDDDLTRPLNVTGTVRRVQVVGGAGAASGVVRDVLVWLPPGYDDPANAGRRYPVLYMQDGQNVFDHRPPTPAEWGADETATRLIEAGEMEPIIIAAIPNSGANRMHEYLPGEAMGVEGQADAYIDWMVREVVPRVERAVRANGDPAERGVGGSSLGGLVALRAVERHPGVFGRVLAESPALWLNGRVALAAPREWGARTYIGMGGREYGDGRAEDNERLVGLATKHGSLLLGRLGPGREEDVLVEVDDEAAHDEPAWAERLPEALRFLYPSE